MTMHQKHGANPCRFRGQLTVKRLKTDNAWPKIKSKAAVVRHLAAFALHLAVKYDTGSAHDRRRVGICQLLQRFYEILENENMFSGSAMILGRPEITRHEH